MERISTGTFYDINGLIDEQILLLVSISPSLFKKATINSIEETEVIRKLDSARWANEIGIFKSADINLPILSDSYFVEEKLGNDQSTISYISNTPTQTEVDSLHIVLDSEQNPVLIRAILSNQNALFTSQKSFELNFRDLGDKSILNHYSIQGWQKMTTRDSTSFLLEGEIRLP